MSELRYFLKPHLRGYTFDATAAKKFPIKSSQHDPVKLADVRFGSFSDIGAYPRDVRLVPTFVDFEDYWSTRSLAATVTQTIAAMTPIKLQHLKNRIRAQLITDATGRITCSAL